MLPNLNYKTMKRKIFNYCLFLFVLLAFSSCSRDLSGVWETSRVRFTLTRDFPQILTENGKAVFYATTYEFKPDNSFIRERKVDDELKIKFVGKFSLNNNVLTLKSDSLFSKRIGGEKNRWNFYEFAPCSFGKWRFVRLVSETNLSDNFYHSQFELIRVRRNRVVLRQDLGRNDGYARITLRRR